MSCKWCMAPDGVYLWRQMVRHICGGKAATIIHKTAVLSYLLVKVLLK